MRREQALSEARRQVRRSEVLIAAVRLLADQAMLTRCAWCERVALADQWLEEDERPRFLPRRLDRAATHGICPSCFEQLRADGQSH
jgi:hypothetical protein